MRLWKFRILTTAFALLNTQNLFFAKQSINQNSLHAFYIMLITHLTLCYITFATLRKHAKCIAARVIDRGYRTPGKPVKAARVRAHYPGVVLHNLARRYLHNGSQGSFSRHWHAHVIRTHLLVDSLNPQPVMRQSSRRAECRRSIISIRTVSAREKRVFPALCAM